MLAEPLNALDQRSEFWNLLIEPSQQLTFGPPLHANKIREHGELLDREPMPNRASEILTHFGWGTHFGMPTAWWDHGRNDKWRRDDLDTRVQGAYFRFIVCGDWSPPLHDDPRS